jgi:hypothetical protein
MKFKRNKFLIYYLNYSKLNIQQEQKQLCYAN